MPHDHGHSHDHKDHKHDDHKHDGHDHECHDHDGVHSHAPKVSTSNEKVVLVGFLLTFSFMFVEFVGGILSGSLALIADAGHMLTDAAALALAWAGFRFGRRARDEKRTFGYMRFEILAGFINSITLILLVVWIAYEAVHRLMAPSPILAGPMLAIAVVGLLVNLGVFWMLLKGDTEHVNIKGAMVHVMGDLLGSVAAIVAAIAIFFTGWTPIDPILSVLLSAIVLRSAWALLKASLNVLMEGTPGNVVVSDLKENIVNNVAGVRAVDHVHVWSITSGQPSATMDVTLADATDPATALREIKALLTRDYGISHSTIELDYGQSSAVCTLGAGDEDGAAGGADHGHDHAHDEKKHHDHHHGHAHGTSALKPA